MQMLKHRRCTVFSNSGRNTILLFRGLLFHPCEQAVFFTMTTRWQNLRRDTSIISTMDSVSITTASRKTIFYIVSIYF